MEEEDFVCPNCGAEIGFIDEGYEGDEIVDATPIGVRVTMDEIIDYVFTQLIKEGITPTSGEIFAVIMHYMDFIENRVAMHVEEVLRGDENNANDDQGV